MLSPEHTLKPEVFLNGPLQGVLWHPPSVTTLKPEEEAALEKASPVGEAEARPPGDKRTRMLQSRSWTVISSTSSSADLPAGRGVQGALIH